MAYIQGNTGKFDPDVLMMEKSEVLQHQMQIVQAWEPQSQAWSIKYSATILASLCGMSCIFINNHFRAKMRLYNYARIVTLIPNVAIPSIMSAFTHTVFVKEDILIRDTKCAICLELRAASFQMFNSVVFPMILAPISAYSFAARHRTAVIPDLSKKAGRLYALQSIQKFTKPISSKLLLIAAAQGLIASALAFDQMKMMAKIDVAFAELEREEMSELK